MLASAVQISAVTKIRRHRELPVAGKVVVRQGQKVEARDSIAEAVLSPEHILLDIARQLNLTPQKADEHIQREAGEMVNEDDLIAGPIGMTRRVVRAPRDGQIILAGDGQVLIEVTRPPYQVRAGMPGTVTDLIPNRGAVIETNGALVQGVWGNGQTEFGLMQSKLESRQDELTPDQLDVSLRGVFILGGHCADRKVLHKAANIPLRGLILASLKTSLVPLAQKMPYPILVTDGFGPHPMNVMSYNVLTTNDGREISVNAEPLDRFHGNRPEIVIPLNVSEEPQTGPELGEDFATGQKVRLVRAPFLGAIGSIESLPAEPKIFPSGIRAMAAQVNLSNDERVTVPLANLERVI